MALDNWFSNWSPPFSDSAFQQPIRNISDYQAGKFTPLPHLLPLFMTLNVVRHPDKSQRNPTGNLHTTRSYQPRARAPAGLSSYGENYEYVEPPTKFDENKITRVSSKILGFDDPFKGTWSSIRSRTRAALPFEEEHKLNPLEVTGPFKTWYRWKVLDFDYPTNYEREESILNKEYIPENNLPLGIEVYKDRIFLSMPKWKAGVPVTLAQLPRVPKEESPKLKPYPSWDWHSEKTCDVITSVFRMQADNCGRLWVLDSGKISITTEEAKQHCPPKLLIFDLQTDKLLKKYIFPKDFIKEDGLYSNIIVDIRNDDCNDAFAYMADVWRFGLVTYRLLDGEAWRVSDHLFFPDPLASAFKLHHLEFEWTDGIFGLALSPIDEENRDRLLYFHPLSSYREFFVKTSYLRNETQYDKGAFQVVGQSRGPSSHISSSVMDNNGIMYHLLVTQDSIGCWDSKKPYRRENLGILARSNETLVFPNDVRLDQDKKQSMWIVTNRLPYYLIEGLDTDAINFRVLSAYTDESIKGTICDPLVRTRYSHYNPSSELDCY
ncbi:hypothetical protein GWI33_003987 [Rhynchophorus ferrugineus]|uniref:Uncharacterized protein n=1 Tax=Rhynchophorus ferrugineus TaxID=354439 RepID=A0A834HI88_RHYFE|nr:hypothetical protein GWI33_003987 [Rhynchophorus ferrugineus]